MSNERRGALVVSLDFELHWGVRDHRPLDAKERARLLAARKVVPDILSVFRSHSLRGTWATVGSLFARSRDEAEECRPALMPRYAQAEISILTMNQWAAMNRTIHFISRPRLIRMIQQTPGQELGSHSYSHYYSLEDGQNDEEFEADLASAKDCRQFRLPAAFLRVSPQSGAKRLLTYLCAMPDSSPTAARSQSLPRLRSIFRNNGSRGREPYA